MRTNRLPPLLAWLLLACASPAAALGAASPSAPGKPSPRRRRTTPHAPPAGGGRGRRGRARPGAGQRALQREPRPRALRLRDPHRALGPRPHHRLPHPRGGPGGGHGLGRPVAAGERGGLRPRHGVRPAAPIGAARAEARRGWAPRGSVEQLDRLIIATRRRGRRVGGHRRLAPAVRGLLGIPHRRRHLHLAAAHWTTAAPRSSTRKASWWASARSS